VAEFQGFKDPEAYRLETFSLMLGVNMIGVEHWVGGILEFARLWSEHDPYLLKRVSQRKLTRMIFDN
jgi:hypothetical protein